MKQNPLGSWTLSDCCDFCPIQHVPLGSVLAGELGVAFMGLSAGSSSVCSMSSPLSTGPGSGVGKLRDVCRSEQKVGRGFSRLGTEGGSPSPH